MNLNRLRNGTVLVKIDKDNKRKVFETDLENASGEKLSLIKALEAGSESDEYYSQSVYIGEVILVADDVKHIIAGDLIVLDYLADTDEKKIAYFKDGEKYILLDVHTKYHTEDRIAYASMRSRMDTFTWRKGDVDTQSLVYAILRNGLLIANNDYILLEHRNLTWEGKKQSGLTYFETEGDIVVRNVISAPEHSAVKAGDIIVVETFALLERSIDKYNFDIVMEIDLLGSIIN